jgi:uncharacterized protein
MHLIRKTSWISWKVTIRSSNIEGKGMFANADINKGETVVIWGGNYVSLNELKQTDTTNKLVMQWDDDLYSVDDKGDDDSYFINHSCDPNIWMIDAFTLVARRDIPTNIEITADYALWEADEEYVSRWQCVCGSTLCRRWVTGKDWRIKDLQTRYSGHFSPLINKRILTNQ